MEDIFKKIGIYDFFGIWGAGAVILNYFIFTIMRIKRIHILWLLSHYETDFSTLFIFIFCVTAYFLGLIMHEIGKIFYELKGKKYNIEKIDDITTIDFSILKNIKKGRHFLLFYFIPLNIDKWFCLNRYTNTILKSPLIK